LLLVEIGVYDVGTTDSLQDEHLIGSADVTLNELVFSVDVHNPQPIVDQMGNSTIKCHCVSFHHHII
jgi:hypothetical protein